MWNFYVKDFLVKIYKMDIKSINFVLTSFKKCYKCHFFGRLLVRDYVTKAFLLLGVLYFCYIFDYVFGWL